MKVENNKLSNDHKIGIILERIEKRKIKEVHTAYLDTLEKGWELFKNDDKRNEWTISKSEAKRIAEQFVNDKYRGIILDLKNKCEHSEVVLGGGLRAGPGQSYDNQYCKFCGQSLGKKYWR
jgi:hypothetical protein